MKKSFLEDWKFLVLIFLLLLKTFQVLDSHVSNKIDTLNLLRKKEHKLLFMQKKTEKILSTLRKQREKHKSNCSIVCLYSDSRSVIEVESNIQSSLSSFMRGKSIKLLTFNWGILTEDLNEKDIKYLPFSLTLKGNIESLSDLICYLISLNKILLVDAFSLTELADKRFVLNLSLKLVCIDKQLCQEE